MKILHVTPCYYPAIEFGGPIQSIHSLCAALVKKRHAVTVYTTTAGIDSFASTEEHEIDNVRVRYFPVQLPKSWFRSPELAAAVRRDLRSFDVVHAHWLYVAPTAYAARSCAAQKIPYVLAPRGMLDKYAITMRGAWKKRLYLNLIEKSHLRGAGAIHFTSYGEKDNALYGMWNSSSFVVPNGIDLNAFVEPPAGDPLYTQFREAVGNKMVLYLGRMNYIKGVDILAKAWPVVTRSVPDAHLVVAGSGEPKYVREMRTLFRGGGATANVTYTGFLNGHEKLNALFASKVLVCPSYLESFGMSIIEALACGRPVVITDRVRIGSIIGDAGAGVVAPCDAEAIAKSLIQVLTDDGAQRRMGNAGRKLVEREFTSDDVAERMIACYRKVLE